MGSIRCQESAPVRRQAHCALHSTPFVVQSCIHFETHTWLPSRPSFVAHSLLSSHSLPQRRRLRPASAFVSVHAVAPISAPLHSRAAVADCTAAAGAVRAAVHPARVDGRREWRRASGRRVGAAASVAGAGAADCARLCGRQRRAVRTVGAGCTRRARKVRSLSKAAKHQNH